MAAEKLKIGLVLDTSLDPMDGVQQYVVCLGEWLRNQGHDVRYIVGQTEQRQLPGIHSMARNVHVRFNGNRTTIPLPTSRRKLRHFLEQEAFDVLHVQIPHSPFMAHRLILAASPQTAVIGTFHIAPYNRLVKTGNQALGRWLRQSLKRFDHIVSVSTAAQAFAKQTFHVDSTVLPNVIDYKLFNTAKPFSKYQGKVLNILFLGRLVPRKGCQVLLEAIDRLKADEALPEFRVIICGKGPLLAKLKRHVAHQKLGGIVEFVGFVPETDKPRYYASADIAVFPSSAGESFGIVLIEAMASGHSAVLAGDNPGYRSVMQPREKLLFKPRDADELADKLRLYLTDAKERQAARDWGRTHAKNYDVYTVGGQLLEIYNKALRKRRAQ